GRGSRRAAMSSWSAAIGAAAWSRFSTGSGSRSRTTRDGHADVRTRAGRGHPALPPPRRPADRGRDRRLHVRRLRRGRRRGERPASHDRLLRPRRGHPHAAHRSEEHTSELQSRFDLVCRLLLEKKKKKTNKYYTQLTDTTIY